MKRITLTFALFAALASASCGAPMGPAFTYQGRLEDGGRPANNVYDLTFTLHDDPVNVPSIGTYIILTAVPVTNGLFTVQLNANGEFGTNAFNGQARWLQIGVRTNSVNVFNNFTFLAPRQLLTPAPMAFFASSAAQAATASSANTATTANSANTANVANVANSVVWANVSGLPGSFADGVDNDTTYTAGNGLTLSNGNQFNVRFAGNGSSNNAARSDHGHFGAQWTGATPGNGISVLNSSVGAGLYGQQGTGSGQVLFFSPPVGVWGESSDGYGVHGASGGSAGAGVYGLATSTNGNAVGVSGLVTSTRGTNFGVKGVTLSSGGAGVYGRNGSYATNRHRDSVQNAGVFGESHFNNGVAGVSDDFAGVVGVSSYAAGVAGFSDGNYGVLGQCTGGTGVSGNSYSGDGVYGYSSGGRGVQAYSVTGVGLAAVSGSGNLIEAHQAGGGSPQRRFYVSGSGNVYASGTFHPGGADFAEILPAQNALEPADVLVIGGDGKLARSTEPYQENLAGVHATKPGMLGGAHDGADLTGKVPLAVVGIVPVKATNENGGIKPGDKLTSSSTAGHAMKAGNDAKIGTVVGKALSALEGERGVIQMLVVLQ
jgi:hypothetical protein